MITKTKEHQQSMVPFFIMWGGQATSLFGSRLVQFALIWWLAQETGSATVLATAALVGLLPQVVIGPIAGTLVDRWNRRLTMIVADSLVALATLVLAYLFWTGQVEIWHVYAIMFFRAVAGSFHWPAMSASTTLMVPEKQLSRVQGLNQMLQGALNIAAAPLGALLLGIMSIEGVLLIDVFTALLAVVTLLLIHVPQPDPAKSGEEEAETGVQAKASFRSDLVEGLRYVWGWPGLLAIVLMAMLINLLLTPAFSLLPLLVSGYFKGDAMQLGLIEAIFGIGIVLGGVLLGVWGGFRKRIVTALSGMVVMGLGVILLGVTPVGAFALAVVSALLIGLSNSITNGPILAVLQASVIPEMQGRVFGLVGSGAAAMAPLGLIVAGPVADAIGVRTWYVIAGILVCAIGLAGFFIPAVMQVEDNGHVTGQEDPSELDQGTEKAEEKPAPATEPEYA